MMMSVIRYKNDGRVRRPIRSPAHVPTPHSVSASASPTGPEEAAHHRRDATRHRKAVRTAGRNDVL
jgi:hypothetical protein